MPSMIVIVRRLIHTDGSITAALEAVLNRAASRAGWATGGSRVRPHAGVLGGGPAQRTSPPDGES
jgi:hypothetical protein